MAEWRNPLEQLDERLKTHHAEKHERGCPDHRADNDP
jgi:hypothetical protein